jgi:hypothetical protein
VKRNIFILTLLLAVAVFSIAPVIAQCGPAVEISKTPFCLTYPGPGPGEPGDRYSSNPIAMDDGIPVYPTHMKLFWWIEITVTANVDLTDVVVYDRLGAEFMVEGIYFHNDGSKLPKPGPDPEPDLNYTFDYAGKDTLVETIAYGQDVSANGYTGTVDKGDMFKGTDGGINIYDDYDFRIFWTGNSCKVHFMWTIGGMTAGETATIYLVISTDLNPAGHQEFTSCGTYFLNSGATVKGFVNGKQVSAEANPIKIKAVDVPVDD